MMREKTDGERELRRIIHQRKVTKRGELVN
jgi:hypothetical protein